MKNYTWRFGESDHSIVATCVKLTGSGGPPFHEKGTARRCRRSRCSVPARSRIPAPRKPACYRHRRTDRANTPASRGAAMDETIPKRQTMADLDGVRVNPAIAAIDEGNALEEQGRIAEAMARYDAAVRADPHCARAHLNRGNILLARGEIDEARSAYELAIACDPRYAGAHFNLGNLNVGAGESERALLNYQAAIDLSPDFADAFVAMANALDNLGRTAEAAEKYESALAINPGYAEVHFNLGILAATQGR